MNRQLASKMRFVHHPCWASGPKNTYQVLPWRKNLCSGGEEAIAHVGLSYEFSNCLGDTHYLFQVAYERQLLELYRDLVEGKLHGQRKRRVVPWSHHEFDQQFFRQHPVKLVVVLFRKKMSMPVFLMINVKSVRAVVAASLWSANDIL
jgi:hypothetical protein